jgi:hypothetical protein
MPILSVAYQATNRTDLDATPVATSAQEREISPFIVSDLEKALATVQHGDLVQSVQQSYYGIITVFGAVHRGPYWSREENCWARTSHIQAVCADVGDYKKPTLYSVAYLVFICTILPLVSRNS